MLDGTEIEGMTRVRLGGGVVLEAQIVATGIVMFNVAGIDR